MGHNYELIADLVKRYDNAIFLAENRFKNSICVFLSVFLFAVAGYFFLDAFFFHEFDNSHFFYVVFILLGILNINFSEKEFVSQIHILIAEFFYYNKIAKEIDHIQHAVLLDLVKHIDNIKTMSKEEHGPWSEHAQKALWILEADYKWKLLT